MCGITGIYRVRTGEPVSKTEIIPMTEALAHRGPDEYGYYINGNLGLGHSRLSIIDLAGGSQPVYNEDKSICVVFNGEIFNYIELRELLLSKGHRFYTSSDTETLVHAYEEYGKDFVDHLNGQFAIALWNSKKRELILTRDRVGIVPLFYSILADGTFLFGSEMKAILASKMVTPEIDAEGVNQIFSLWVNIPPGTVFKGINELAPGKMLSVSASGIKESRYWNFTFPDISSYEDKPLSYYTSRLEELIYDSVKIRLRSDVPVASYLSGGLDSSIVSALVKKHHNNDLITFSVGFKDGSFDERAWQMEMVEHIGTDHRMVEADYGSISSSFSDVIYHGEKPIIRSAPAPLYILSRLVRENGIKVVLTGEGADEFFGGYNIFKEDMIRRFMARVPGSDKRPKLLSALYPYVARNSRGNAFWLSFFKKGLSDTENPFYSHSIRWGNTSQIKRFFKDGYLDEEKDINSDLSSYLSPEMSRWHPLCRAQYIESALFLPGYLLSSQGDRMLMANSVEGRFPFLDHRVIEFASTIPPEYKIRGLNEKYALKKTYENILPASISTRPKQPYRAPIAPCFIDRDTLASSMFNKETIERYGYFDSDRVEMLLNKYRNSTGNMPGERDDMTLAGIASTQLLHYHFVEKRSL